MIKKSFTRQVWVNLKNYGLNWAIITPFYFIAKKISERINEKEPHKEEIIKKVNGLNMVLCKGTRGIHADLIEEGMREPLASEAIKRYLKKGDTILEIGANIGYYVLLDSKYIGDEGKIFAVEPEEENFKYLQKNVKINGLKNVKLYNTAISGCENEIKINIYEEGNLNSAFEIPNKKKKNTIKIGAISLENFIQKEKASPDFIRMDIEGYESEVLLNSKKILESNTLKKMFIELHFGLTPPTEMKKLLKLLIECGFEASEVFVERKSISSKKNIYSKIEKFLYYKRKKYKKIEGINLRKMLKDSDILEGYLGALEVFLVKK
jgi:FkbM family methyltransferase